MFNVSTYVGQSILVDRFYRGCTITINQKDTIIDWVDLDMVDFDIILNLDWLHAWYASVDFKSRVVMFEIPKDTIIEWKSCSTMPQDNFIA